MKIGKISIENISFLKCYKDVGNIFKGYKRPGRRVFTKLIKWKKIIIVYIYWKNPEKIQLSPIFTHELNVLVAINRHDIHK